jgi:hypothetical protein
MEKRMKNRSGKGKNFLRGLLIFEIIVCYMAVLTIVSHIRGPQQYKTITTEPLVTVSDFVSFDGASMQTGNLLPFRNETLSSAVGYEAQLTLSNLDSIHISFEVYCPAEYSGGILAVDLYDYESGYDSDEQEYDLILQEGMNTVSFSLKPGEDAPEVAQIRVFTLYTADYEVNNIQIYREIILPKVTLMMWAVVVACFTVLVATGGYWASVRKNTINSSVN